MEKQQNGFTAIEVLLVFMAFALIGMTGWYVWHSNHHKTGYTVSTHQAASTETTIIGTLQDIDCATAGGTAESSPQCGWVLQTPDATYNLQGDVVQQYTNNMKFSGHHFKVTGTLNKGGTNNFGQPEPSVIQVTNMVEV